MNEWIIAAAVFLGIYWFIARAGKISPTEARKLVGEGARLLDVRTPGEFASGHIEGALNVPVQELSGRVQEVGPADATYVVYCASGMRSASAKRILKASGRTKTHDLGAMGRW